MYKIISTVSKLWYLKWRSYFKLSEPYIYGFVFLNPRVKSTGYYHNEWYKFDYQIAAFKFSAITIPT